MFQEISNLHCSKLNENSVKLGNNTTFKRLNANELHSIKFKINTWIYQNHLKWFRVYITTKCQRTAQYKTQKKYLDVPESFEMDAGLYYSYDIKEALEIIEFIEDYLKNILNDESMIALLPKKPLRKYNLF